MDIKKKVEELALTLPECPVPLAAYVPATRFGNTIVVSGQLPSVKGDFSAYTGTVPTELPIEKAVEAARICLLNNIAAAMTQLQHGETLRLVQMQGFVQSAADFQCSRTRKSARAPNAAWESSSTSRMAKKAKFRSA